MPGVELESSPCSLPRIEDMDRGDWGKGANFVREPDACNMATPEVQDAESSEKFRDHLSFGPVRFWSLMAWQYTLQILAGHSFPDSEARTAMA